MLDIHFIRENSELVKQASKVKGYQVDVDKLLDLDKEGRRILAQAENIRQERNNLADKIKQSQKPTSEQVEQGKQLKAQLSDLEEKLYQLTEEITRLHKAIPNLPAADVPIGNSEDDNVVSQEVGDKPEFDFKPKSHWEIGESKGWIDKERAAKVAGSRFAYIKGDLARLHFALMQYAIDQLTDSRVLENIAQRAGLRVSAKPFELVLPPLMIRTEAYDAMDRLEPRDDRYKIEGEDLWLQGSAEHVMGSMHQNERLNSTDLPIRYVGYATSFRKEAGTYGKDSEGIFRMHQFDKLEMESLTTAETALDEHLFMIAIQQYLMEQLQLPYRVVMKCTADIGKPNARGVDIDVWLPGQEKYRETHTADYMTDYQARRLQTRVRKSDDTVELVHTNDATVFSQRPLIAILENYQTPEGDVIIPDVLQPYFGSRDRI